MDILGDHHRQRFAVKDIGRVDDLRRMLACAKTGSQSPSNLTRADRIHHPATSANQIEHREIRIRLLCESYHVERLQICQPTLDPRGIVDKRRSAELAS